MVVMKRGTSRHNASNTSASGTVAAPIQPELEIIIATGLLEIDDALANAAEKHRKGALILVLGIVRSPGTKCWQVCMSRNGAPVVWVSAHRRRRDAEAQIKLVRQVDKPSDLNGNDSFDRLLEELRVQSDADLQHLSHAPPRLHTPRCKPAVANEQVSP